MQRLKAVFHGTVQGVGFRASARVLAQEMGLKGYIMNLPDGTVELVAEGEKEVLDRFLKIMKSKEILGQTIVENVDVSRTDATGEFGKFEIRK